MAMANDQRVLDNRRKKLESRWFFYTVDSLGLNPCPPGRVTDGLNIIILRLSKTVGGTR